MMADQGGQQRELVFCHACENEWNRHQHGLVCPECQSDAVEIIEENNDPRDDHIDLTRDDDNDNDRSSPHDDALPRHPLHHHHQWGREAPDPDEGDIEHVTFSPAPGIHFEHTTFRSTSPLNRQAQGQHANDAFAPLFQSLAGMFNGPGPGQPTGGGPPNPQYTPGRPHTHIHGTWMPNQTGGPQYTARMSAFPAGSAGDPNMTQPLNGIHAIMQTMLASIEANAVPPGHGDPHTQHRGPPDDHPLNFIHQALSQLRNPANAAHGDAVFTDEAMDRIISQMMEQNAQGQAPGPASAAAIAALPKRPADKEMVGTDGKAECSVCMDSVLLGDTVTVLPCQHWFHGDCVGAWLQEHDTCPHCRQGIMPKDATAEDNTPGSQGQMPHQHGSVFGPMPTAEQFMNTASSPPPPPHNGPPFRSQILMPGAFTQPGMQHPYGPEGYRRYPEPGHYIHPNPPFPSMASTQPETGHLGTNTRGSNGSENGENGGGASGTGPAARVTGWLRNLRGGSGSANGNHEQR